MGLKEILEQPLERRDDCIFCDLGEQEVGYRDGKNPSNPYAIKVFETGRDLQRDWYGLLQRNVTSDPETGFRLLLLPTAHAINFVDTGRNQYLAENFGVAFSQLSRAMQLVREEESQDDNYTPAQIVYGKCKTRENTKEHLHLKLDEFSGGLAQAFPSDAGWVYMQKRGRMLVKYPETGLYRVLGVEEDISDGVEVIVAGEPVHKVKLSVERLDHLASRLRHYLDE